MNRVTLFMKRKPGLSFEQFKDHYENVHIPLNERWIGRFMTGFIRIYPQDLQNFSRGEELTTPDAGCNYDAVSIYSVRDELALRGLLEVAQNVEYQKLIAEDEEKFCDRASSRFGLSSFHSGVGLNARACEDSTQTVATVAKV